MTAENATAQYNDKTAVTGDAVIVIAIVSRESRVEESVCVHVSWMGDGVL